MEQAIKERKRREGEMFEMTERSSKGGGQMLNKLKD